MKLTMFQSDKGDALLMEAQDGKHRMLIDGGMRRAYSRHVAPALGELRSQGKAIDIAYVSHVDQDHISGILQMLDDEVAWRVHEHQVANGNPGHPKPESPRPPRIGAVLHNSFHDQVGKNAGPIENLLAATASILSASTDPWVQEVADARRDLAASIPEAMRVSHRLRKGQLGIPLNPHSGGKLLCIREGQAPIKLGAIELKIIGPAPKDLANLRKKWNSWLASNSVAVARLRKQAAKDADAIHASDVDRSLAPILSAAAALGAMEVALAKELGNRKYVTAPNLASLMFLAEEKGQTVLLTGDGHCDDVLTGLEHHGAFDASDRLRVDVLKVPHHGSENNIHAGFCDRVSASHYVFCGNGEHENPDLDVLDVIFRRRMADGSGTFRFWFNSSSTASANTDGRAHMREVEKLVAKQVAKSHGRLSSRFIKGSSLTVL